MTVKDGSAVWVYEERAVGSENEIIS